MFKMFSIVNLWCHSNQLINWKPLQRFFIWTVSKSGSVGHTIVGKTADVTVVQMSVIDALHREAEPQKVITKEAGCSQSAGSKQITQKLSGRNKWQRKRCTSDRDNSSRERVVLTLRAQEKKKTGLSLSRPVLFFFFFSNEALCCESGRRKEAQNSSFHSQWWLKVPCHLLVSGYCVF